MARFHIAVADESNARRVADAHTAAIGDVVSTADQLAVIDVPAADADHIADQLDADDRIVSYRRYDA
jgi:hypothetical protein